MATSRAFVRVFTGLLGTVLLLFSAIKEFWWVISLAGDFDFLAKSGLDSEWIDFLRRNGARREDVQSAIETLPEFGRPSDFVRSCPYREPEFALCPVSDLARKSQ
jgi:hypothetical protein